MFSLVRAWTDCEEEAILGMLIGRMFHGAAGPTSRMSFYLAEVEGTVAADLCNRMNNAFR